MLEIKVYALVAIVLNTSPGSASVEDHARYAIRNTQRHSTFTTRDQKRSRWKEGAANMSNQKPTKGKGKSKSMCAPPFAL